MMSPSYAYYAHITHMCIQHEITKLISETMYYRLLSHGLVEFAHGQV
jgi:hypothetical protein